jgi:hypothetical protein
LIALLDLLPAQDRYRLPDDGLKLLDGCAGRDGRVELGEDGRAGAGGLERLEAQVLLVVKAEADELQRRPTTAWKMAWG